MVATTPGTYRIPPTIVRSLYRPTVMHLNKADQVLTVLPRAVKSEDKYRLTPDELYNLGRLHFDDGDYEPATAYLKELLAGEWLLRDEPYRESVRMLLSSALKRGDAAATVNYFEILKEKYPDLVIPFEGIVKVADAYARTEQHERAYSIYRATADASFARDPSVGGAVQGEGSGVGDGAGKAQLVGAERPAGRLALFAQTQHADLLVAGPQGAQAQSLGHVEQQSMTLGRTQGRIVLA